MPAQRASCGDASGGACGGTAGRDGERRRRGTERRGSCGGSETHGTGLRGQDRAPGSGDEGAAYDDAGAEADGRGLRGGGEPRLSTAGLEALRINGAELLRGEDIVAEIARAKGDGCTPRRLTDALAEARGAAAPLTLFALNAAQATERAADDVQFMMSRANITSEAQPSSWDEAGERLDEVVGDFQSVRGRTGDSAPTEAHAPQRRQATTAGGNDEAEKTKLLASTAKSGEKN